jgi:hypothetical protein
LTAVIRRRPKGTQRSVHFRRHHRDLEIDHRPRLRPFAAGLSLRNRAPEQARRLSFPGWSAFHDMRTTKLTSAIPLVMMAPVSPPILRPIPQRLPRVSFSLSMSAIFKRWIKFGEGFFRGYLRLGSLFAGMSGCCQSKALAIPHRRPLIPRSLRCTHRLAVQPIPMPPPSIALVLMHVTAAVFSHAKF